MKESGSVGIAINNGGTVLRKFDDSFSSSESTMKTDRERKMEEVAERVKKMREAAHRTSMSSASSKKVKKEKKSKKSSSDDHSVNSEKKSKKSSSDDRSVKSEKKKKSSKSEKKSDKKLKKKNTSEGKKSTSSSSSEPKSSSTTEGNDGSETPKRRIVVRRVSGKLMAAAQAFSHGSDDAPVGSPKGTASPSKGVPNRTNSTKLIRVRKEEFLKQQQLQKAADPNFKKTKPQRTNSTKLVYVRKEERDKQKAERGRAVAAYNSDTIRARSTSVGKDVKKNPKMRSKSLFNPEEAKIATAAIAASKSEDAEDKPDLRASMAVNARPQGVRPKRRMSTGYQVPLTTTEIEQLSHKKAAAGPKLKGCLRTTPQEADLTKRAKKVWYASDDTIDFYENKMMHEEEVPELWWDHLDLEYFKSENHKTVEELLSRSEVDEWVKIIKTAFEACGGAKNEQDMGNAKAATFKLKELYSIEADIIGLEHLVFEDMKYDGNRRRGTMLDLCDKIQDERYYRRRLSGKGAGSNHQDEGARLAFQCTESSRPSRFFMHGAALARFAVP